MKRNRSLVNPEAETFWSRGQCLGLAFDSVARYLDSKRIVKLSASLVWNVISLTSS